LAATEPNERNRNPDWTVGMKLGRRRNGRVVIADVVRVRRNSSTVRDIVYDTAVRDGTSCWIQIPRDPGQAGSDQIDSYGSMLAGFCLFSRPITRNKVTMAEPAATAWQRGTIEMLVAPWNTEVLEELDQFPTPNVHDDCVDALSGGFNLLPSSSEPDYAESGLSRRFRQDY
jgi:predicted phage terminase large subunit-like protein